MRPLGKLYFNLWIRIYYYNNRYILRLKRKRAHKNVWKVILLLTIPYILIRWVFLVCLEKLFIPSVRRANRKEKGKVFQYEMAIVAIAKNEAPYIKEWVEYHRLLGVTQFYFYDNESEDNTSDIVKPYVESGLLTYSLIKGKARQLDAYNDALVRYKDRCRYMAFIDLDEYIMPATPYRPIAEVVEEILEKHGKGASGIGINWAIYGSSGFDKTPDGLITRNFNHRGRNREVGNAHIKTICNPRRVAFYISPHYPLYKTGSYSVGENGERLYVWFCDKREYRNIRINHYYTKSKEQFLGKISRGLGDRIGEYRQDMFNRYDLNEIEDNSMLVYADALEKRMPPDTSFDN